jgi:hypothetical protein
MSDGTFDMDNAALGLTMALFLSTSNANTLSVGTGVYGDLTNEHANANGYITGGIALTGETWLNAAGVSTFDASDGVQVWTAAGGSITARFGVIYCNATVNGIVKPLFSVCLLESPAADVTATNGNTFTVNYNASGIITVSGATTD